jgi:WD40 repeat protein
VSGEAVGPDCPYVGLAPFEAAHTAYFFGRTLDSAVLADNVLARKIVVLYGASGVGKSSVLNVGLPKAFDELSLAVRIVSRSNWYEPERLHGWLDELIDHAGTEPARPLLIVLDQFEEYFLYAHAEQAKAFARSLAGLITWSEVEVHLLFAVRDDGLHRLDALRIDLPTLLETTLELRHLDETAVKEAIKSPIAVWNQRHAPVTVDDNFPDALLEELRPRGADAQPAKGGRIELAYLQLALEKIWEAEGGAATTTLRTATLTDRLKGISEISRRHVEDVLSTLPEADQALCATVFDRLVTPSGGKILYATVDLAKVARVTPERMDGVLSQLALGRARLLRAVELPGRTHTRGYEILHDILARPILDWREHRVARIERDRADAEAKARQQAEDDRSRLSRMTKGLVAVVALLAIAVALAFWAVWRANTAEHSVREHNLRAQGLRLLADAQNILSGAGSGGDERAMLELIASTQLVRISEVDAALLAELRSRLRKLVMTPTAMSAVAISPDGRRIASVGDDQTLRLWDAESGAAIGKPLTAHGDGVSRVTFSPDGKIMASGSTGATVRLWDARTGEPIGDPLAGHTAAVTSIAFSSNSQRLVSGSDDSTLRIWDAGSGKPIGPPLTGHEGGVLSVAFSSDGRRVVSGSDDSTLRIWDSVSGKSILPPLKGHTGGVLSVAFSPDGSRVVSAGGDRTVRLWDVLKGLPALVQCRTTKQQPVGLLCPKHTDEVTSVVYSPDGRHIASASADRTVRMWDAVTGEPIEPALTGHEDVVTSIVFRSDSRRVVSGSLDRTFRVWDAGPANEHSIGVPLQGHRGTVWSVAFDNDGRRIVSGSSDGELRLWDTASELPIGEPLKGHSDRVLSVAFSPDGRRVVSGSADRTLRLWNPLTSQPINSPSTGHADSVLSVAFSPDGIRIVSGSADRTVRLWDAQTGRPIGQPLQGHKDAVWNVAFSPNAPIIVSGSADRTLRLWDAATGRPIGVPLTGHTDNVSSVAFSPDGGRIVSGSGDHTLRVWDVRSGQPIGQPLEGHREAVWGVAFSPDGRLIVSGSTDGTLRVWDASTGRPVDAPLMGHKAGVLRVAFSPDGRRIVSSGDDNMVRLWPGPADWPAKLCSKITRNMTASEWRNWVSPDLEYRKQCSALPIPSDTHDDAGREVITSPSRTVGR